MDNTYTIASVSRGVPRAPYLYSFIGKSIYPKPSIVEFGDMGTGSELYDIDTQSVFMYDRDNDSWIQQ